MESPVTARGRVVERALPAIAVVLGLISSARHGGFEMPTPFLRAVLVVGVLCPMMMGECSTRIGRIVLRPRARLLPLIACLGAGPALAFALGRLLLPNRPEQATALLLLSILPGSALAPIWARSVAVSRSTAIALALIGWAITTFVSLPLLAGPHLAVARFVAFRELALLGVMPLAVGSLLRAVLADAFEPEECAAAIEPVREAVLQISLAVLLFCVTASKESARVITQAAASLPAFGAVVLLYLGLILCGLVPFAVRTGLSKMAAGASLQVAATRQTLLASAVLPLLVTPAELATASVVPMAALVLELACGAAACALSGSRPWSVRAERDGATDGHPSILPE